MKAIIAAGGSGTRLRPLTFSSNKHLLPIANKPLLLYPFEAIVDVGIKEIGLVVNETRPAIENLLGDGSQWGVKISYIEQNKPLGLAHVVKICQDFLGGDAFVYHLGDNIFTQGIRRPFEHFQKTQPDALLTMVTHPENYRLGVPYFDAEGNLEKVVEKPTNPPNQFGVPGLYFFNHHVFEAFEGEAAIKPSQRGELEITDLYSYLLSKGYRVETEEVEGKWMDPGKFNDMLEANQYLLEINQDKLRIGGVVDANSQTKGKVGLGEGSKLVNSQVEGPVVVGSNTVIQDCLIQAGVSIGNNCKLEGVTLSNSIIMDETTIFGVKRKINNSIIGRNAEIWEESQSETSLFVGDHCRIKLA